jgi:hypothetical protein
MEDECTCLQCRRDGRMLPPLPATILTVTGFRIYPPITPGGPWIVRKDGKHIAAAQNFREAQTYAQR